MEKSRLGMNRLVATAVAALILVGAWSLLKARILVLSPQSPAQEIPQEQVLWSADPSHSLANSGDDPRAVFANSLTRYLQNQVSGASAWPSEREIDPMVVSIGDRYAHVKATVRGVAYHGVLEWGANGWQLDRLSCEK